MLMVIIYYVGHQKKNRTNYAVTHKKKQDGNKEYIYANNNFCSPINLHEIASFFFGLAIPA